MGSARSLPRPDGVLIVFLRLSCDRIGSGPVSEDSPTENDFHCSMSAEGRLGRTRSVPRENLLVDAWVTDRFWCHEYGSMLNLLRVRLLLSGGCCCCCCCC